MLRPRGSFVGLACLVVLVATPKAAFAEDGDPIVVTGDTHPGAVDTTVTSSGSQNAQPVVGVPSSTGSDNGVTCMWKAESDYSQQAFQWLGSDPNGTWYDVTCADGSSFIGVYVPPAAGNVPPAVVLAGSLAQSAANRLVLPTPRVRHSPKGYTLVGLETWWWVDPAQWQPLRQRTQAGPVWAEVTVTPASTTWDAGDGSAPVVCVGPGTPYDTSRPAASQSTDCSHTYRRSSADQPQTGSSPNDRLFTVTVTTNWQVTWVGSLGSSGTLPVLTTSSTFGLPVAQRQTVVTGGSG